MWGGGGGEGVVGEFGVGDGPLTRWVVDCANDGPRVVAWGFVGGGGRGDGAGSQWGSLSGWGGDGGEWSVVGGR